MMKTKNFWTLIAILGLTLLMFTGCGKDDDNGNPVAPGHNPALVGTWITVEYYLLNSPNPTAPNPDGMPPLIEVTLNEDGTLEYTSNENGEEMTGTGTWSTTGSNATIDLTDGPKISGTYSLNEAGDELMVDATISYDMTPDDGVVNPVDIPATIIFDKVE